MVAFSLLAALASVLSLSVAAPAAELVARDSSACVTGDAVHIIVARASTELPGEGIIGQVVTMIKSQLPGSTSEAVSYPATLYPYLSSEAAGVSAMTSLVQSYVARCGEGSRLILAGYSQGAQVVGDTLCGSSGLFGGFSVPSGFGSSTSSPWSFSGLSKRDLDSFNTSTDDALAKRQLSSSISGNIVAAIQMGDPSFVPGQSFDAGTSRMRGLFPRSSSGVQCLQGFADRLRSYCDTGDEFCASGFSLAVHLSYVQRYGAEAAAFAVSRARA
ncbi:carbohydrate esterase family 5 protein [Rhodotorula graminis WP1]|uniref:Carbohydrate esterase family 5 protein n=1 Tax=Rhodotorula graminis (strain WP1) TaxID=578459 RepID=A0A0P9ESL5_RHOGW|nr:carbohydrate esterase family 5 protein [Rhodotorula graminis WP1]KPV72292.1 carbohydrate esterase family 5 protein [Rhodotorula graminis WP1]